MSFSRQNVLQHLQIRLRRVVRAAAAEVRLGDQDADLAAELLAAGRRAPSRYGARIERRVAHRRRRGTPAIGKLMKRTRGSRSRSALAAGDGAGQALLAVEAEPRGQDHRRACDRGPARPRAPSESPRSRTRPTSPVPAACRPALLAAASSSRWLASTSIGVIAL